MVENTATHRYRWTPADMLTVLKDYQHGVPLKTLAKRYGRSAARMRQICANARRMLQPKNSPSSSCAQWFYDAD
jgi:hypothetical protein